MIKIGQEGSLLPVLLQKEVSMRSFLLICGKSYDIIICNSSK